jgi:BlaI family transcriptional regulator, penicillinase repressor
MFIYVNESRRMNRKAASPAITEAESVIMEVLWRRSPLATEEVVAALAGQQSWRMGTIKAFLNRLLRKRAIHADRDGRRFLYSPLVSRDEWLLSESKGLLDRLFAGRVAPLAAHFSRHGKLTKRDIADLKRLIAELDDEP